MDREVKNALPPWVEYELTDKGSDLINVIEAIETWCDKWDVAESAPVAVSVN